MWNPLQMQDTPALLSPGSHHPNFTSGDPKGLKYLSYRVRLRLPSLPTPPPPGCAPPPSRDQSGPGQRLSGQTAGAQGTRGESACLLEPLLPVDLRPLNPGGASHPDGRTILNQAVGGWAEYPHLQQPVWETRECTLQVIPGRRPRWPPWGMGSDPTVTQLRVSGQASLSHHI